MSLNVKELIKSLVPEKYRLLRYELYERARYFPELVFSLGNKFECPFCRWHFRRLRPAGFNYSVLEKRKVVGASFHLNDVCPRCFSNARERLVYLYLMENKDLFSKKQTLLHIAPEPNLGKLFSEAINIEYISGDLSEPDVMCHLDVTQLPFADNSFDVVICNHVLEHVSNDKVAMGELYRILKTGGWAILQVPIAMALDRTFEDPTATTEEQRIELFGQRDHVRLYAQNDYIDRLQSTGFQVSADSLYRRLPEADVVRYALIPEEVVFVCTKEGVM